jgi:hypothetical protein
MNEPQKDWVPSVDLLLRRKVLAKEPETILLPKRGLLPS